MLEIFDRGKGAFGMNLSGGINNNSSLSRSGGDSKWIENGIHVTSAVTFFIGFPTNFIIIFLVLRRRNLKIPTYFFLTSLAIADILVLLCMMVWITSLHTIRQSRILRSFVFSSLDLFLNVAAMLNVACVSVDRAVAVVLPLKYESFMTKKKACGLIATCWILSFIMLILALFRIAIRGKTYQNIILYVAFGFYFIAIVLLVVAYTIILATVIGKLRKISKLEKMFITTLINDADVSEKRRFRRRKLTRELKITSNILLIVFPFTVGWVFVIGTHVYEEITGDYIINLIHNFIIIVMPWILSALNPVLYLVLNRSLRLSFIATSKKLFKSQSHYIDDTKSSFFSSFSRRASQTFRRASNIADENLSFLSPARYFGKRRDSKMSGVSSQSRDTENHLDICEEIDNSSNDISSSL